MGIVAMSGHGRRRVRQNVGVSDIVPKPVGGQANDAWSGRLYTTVKRLRREAAVAAREAGGEQSEAKS